MTSSEPDARRPLFTGSNPSEPANAEWRPSVPQAAPEPMPRNKLSSLAKRALFVSTLGVGFLLATWLLVSAALNGPATVALISVIAALGCLWGIARVLWRPGATISGTVRGMQMRQEVRAAGTVSVWSFRLERHDASGDRLPPVPIEMRSSRFHGVINDGDLVEVKQRWKLGRTLKPRRIYNLTTGATVTAGSSRVILLLFAAFGVVIIALLALWKLS